MRSGAIFVALLLALGCGRDDKDAQVSAALQTALRAKGQPQYVTRDAEGVRLWKITREFYEARAFAPAWIEGTKPGDAIDDLIGAVWAAEHEGLDPQLYNVGLLDERRQDASKGLLTKKGFEPGEAGALDARLTYLYMKYASDLADGLSDLAHADSRWQIRPEKFDPRARLEEALAERRVAESLRDLTPGNPQYAALREALAELRQQASRGGWARVPKARLKPGERSAAVAAIARRLAGSDDFRGTVPEDHARAAYDAPLVEAVKRFQNRHGLTADGIIGADVVVEMNVSIEERMAQIRLNLERWRWLPRELGDRYILVNVPEYHLEVWDNDRVPVSMRVVVGTRETPTPIFNDVMTHIVLSPYWNVPPGIAEEETLPAVLSDAGFLERHDMEVLDETGKPVDPGSIDLSEPEKYRFRQRPGASNSLGFVKFMFPNQHDVYLHDTPADSLFERASRSFSHGCVRLEEPMALAQYVLRDQPEWTKERLEEAMHAGEERHVKLRQPIPVYLGYWTARVSGDGVLQFRRDVYGIDARQTRLLHDRLARLRKTVASANSRP